MMYCLFLHHLLKISNRNKVISLNKLEFTSAFSILANKSTLYEHKNPSFIKFRFNKSIFSKIEIREHKY